MNEVNLTKRVHTNAGSRFCPVVISGNGRVKPDYVMVNGQDERHTEGAYYIEWRENGKRKRLSVGTDPAQAMARRNRRAAELDALSKGLTLVDEPTDPTGACRSLPEAVAAYLEDIRIAKKPKTLAAYRIALVYFQQSCDKGYLEELDRRDLLQYAAFLRDRKEQAPRSVYNKFENVMTFLKAQGIRGLVKKNDWPRFVESDVEIYDKDDLDNLYKVCSKSEQLWLDFLLMSGVREQEAIYMEWTDIDFKNATVSVRWKEQYNWTPKNYKGRPIPVPDKLMADLKSAKAGSKCPLIFHTEGCKPQMHMLRTLQRIAVRAGLSPDDFWLHKFRATFCTWHLWAGVDLRTVQTWMGHTDMASTLRYLKPNRGQAVRDKVNATFG